MSARPATYDIDGRTVTMPCVVRDASAGTAMFDVDAGGGPGARARGVRPRRDGARAVPGSCWP